MWEPAHHGVSRALLKAEEAAHRHAATEYCVGVPRRKHSLCTPPPKSPSVRRQPAQHASHGHSHSLYTDPLLKAQNSMWCRHLLAQAVADKVHGVRILVLVRDFVQLWEKQAPSATTS